MKTLKMLVLTVLVTCSTVLSASTNPIEKAEPVSITEAVGELLKNPYFNLNKEVHAIVDIFINQNNEIVVLSVDTDNKVLEKYIKTRLNYKKLPKESIGLTKSFKIPVKMVQSN